MPRILVAGDDRDLRDLYASWLTRDGYEVEVLPNHPIDVRPTSSAPFDLVLLDCREPRPGTLHAIRERADRHDVPIVLLTADATRWQVEQADIHGVTAYLRKPFPLRHLSATIERALGGRAATQGAIPPGPARAHAV